MLVHRPQGIRPLIAFGKIAEKITLKFVRVCNIGIKHIHIVGTQTDEADFVFIIDAGFHFKLHVVECRQKGQTDKFKKKLQIRPSYRYKVGCFFAEWSVETQGKFRSAQAAPEAQGIFVTIDLSEIEYTTECIAFVGRKGSGVKIDLTDKISVYNSIGTS